MWHLSTDLQGKEAILDFWGKVMEMGGQAFEVHDAVAGDDHAVALVDTTFTRPDKGTLEMRQVWTFHCADGKITDGWFVNEDKAAADEFWS